jgi:CHAT domain-containing protein
MMGYIAAAVRRLFPSGQSTWPLDITLVPVGLLALLPLHAAWTEDKSTVTNRRYFLDEFAVSYAPSALSVTSGREQSEKARENRVLIVEEPLAVGVSSLPNAHAEAVAVSDFFDSSIILRQAEATRRAVLQALADAQIAHFSCHGKNDWQDPMESGILMADEENSTEVRLTVRDLLKLKNADGRLAVISACETGIVGMDLPDESVALPSAFLQIGFRGVLASLWSVADISTAMLMQYFYRSWRTDRKTLAQSIRAAQLWLRDTTNGEKAEYFRLNARELGDIPSPGQQALLELFKQADKSNPLALDFSHPFWWAAFYLTGA